MTQAAADGSGHVDYRGVLVAELAADRVPAALLSIEYFDLPERGAGWGCADPRAAALEARGAVRGLFG